MQVGSYNMRPFVPGLFHLAQCSQSLHILQNAVPFSWLNSIPLYVDATFYLSVHLLLDNLGCFHLLTIEKNAALDIPRQVFVQTPVFSSFI